MAGRGEAKEVWSADEVRELRLLWDAGVRVPVIANRLGRSKSAIWRKRQLLRLPVRATDVTAKPPTTQPPARPVGKARTLPPLASLGGEDAP